MSYPSSSEVSTILSELSEQLYFFTADRDTQTMSGYRVVTSPPGKELPTALVWTLHFPADTERIISTILKSPNGEIQPHAIVVLVCSAWSKKIDIFSIDILRLMPQFQYKFHRLVATLP